MRSVSWYCRKYSSYFLRLVCFSSARVISGDGVAFSPDGASHDPTFAGRRVARSVVGRCLCPGPGAVKRRLRDGIRAGRLPYPVAEQPRGGRSSRRELLERAFGGDEMRWKVRLSVGRRNGTKGQSIELRGDREQQLLGREIEAPRRGGSSTDAHLGVQSGSRARSERVDRADLGAQHRQQETRTRREPHRRRRSSRVPSQWLGRRSCGPMSTFEREKKNGAGQSSQEPPRSVAGEADVSKPEVSGNLGSVTELFSMEKRGICQKENWRSARTKFGPSNHAEIKSANGR